MMLKFRMYPWMIVAMFLGLLWLLFTTLTLGSDNGFPMRRIVEPKPEVYQNVTPETMQSLKDNFQDLNDRGCLTYVGTSQVGGADVSDMKISCIQLSFVTRALTQVLLVALFLFEMLVLGRLFLHLLRIRPPQLLTECIVSVTAGACCMIAIL